MFHILKFLHIKESILVKFGI